MSYYSQREICRNYRLIICKYYPDKWYNRYLFMEREGEEIFKNLANAHNKCRSNA